MGKQVSKWVADDGQEFDNQKDMLLYEMAVVDAKEIDLFLEAQEVSQRRVTEYKKLLVAWQKHMQEDYYIADKVKESIPDNIKAGWLPDNYAFESEMVTEDDPFAKATQI